MIHEKPVRKKLFNSTNLNGHIRTNHNEFDTIHGGFTFEK